jgi:glutaminyl-peptide cyclotransferase
MKYFLLALLAFTVGCKDESAGDNNGTDNNASSAPPAMSYSVVNIYPHDTSSYTQGLIWFNNSLYEGTGLEGFSKLKKVDLKTGKAQQEISIDKSLFGEGITILNDKIYQLTWENNKVLVYNMNLKKIQEFNWPYQGWGLTNNGSQLIISTGGSNLYFVDPTNFKIQKMVAVTDNNGPVGNLNELEYVKDVVYANIYETDYIVKIDPETGKVIGKLDVADILIKNNITIDPAHKDVLNGIAYDSAKNSFYLTGKWWPALFEVKLN